MPEGKSKKGNIVTRKVGPLPAWGWVASAAGVYLVFRWYSARKAANAALAGTATSGGTTIPAASGSQGTSLPTFSSLGAWEQAAISAMSGSTLSPADALNGLTDWINGQCVTQAQFNGISSIISTVGLPPGFSTVPVLSVCGSSSTAPSNPPAGTGAGLGAGAGVSAQTLAGDIANLGGRDFYGLGHGLPGTGTYTGYEVTGGAPVYFTWDGQGTPKQGPPPSGVTGITVWTPTSTPLTQFGNYVTNA